MFVAETSRCAYAELKELSENNLYDRQQRVHDCIRRYPGMSSSEIARTLTMENERNGIKNKVSPKDVCSRVCELLNDNRIIVSGTKTDRHTGRRVRQYEVIE